MRSRSGRARGQRRRRRRCERRHRRTNRSDLTIEELRADYVAQPLLDLHQNGAATRTSCRPTARSTTRGAFMYASCAAMPMLRPTRLYRVWDLDLDALALWDRSTAVSRMVECWAERPSADVASEPGR